MIALKKWMDKKKKIYMTSKGIFMLKGRAEKEPSDVVIVLEAVIVLQDLHNLAFATVVLFGLLYILNLKYPRKLRYTSEILPHIATLSKIHIKKIRF
uniref:Uncharacterized protein n=1 Tax=Sinocyclocheilus rhinocerous TaxID=307959 RepID=A0A673KVF8_9TELE